MTGFVEQFGPKEVDGAGREEGGRLGGNGGGLHPPARAGGNEGGELRLGHAHPGRQVAGDGLAQGAYERALAAVQGLQTVEADVGRAQFRPLHPIADSLQGAEHLLEHAPAGGLVRLQHGRVRAPRERLFQGHAGDHRGGGREGVDDKGLPRGAVDDHGRALPQVGLASQLDLGPEMGDEHAGDPQGVPPMASSGSDELRVHLIEHTFP